VVYLKEFKYHHMKRLDEYKSFVEVIEFNKPITVEEAVKIFADYHNVKDTVILNTFVNMRGFTGMIRFVESVTASKPCVKMEGMENGVVSWSCLVSDQGLPIARCG